MRDSRKDWSEQLTGVRNQMGSRAANEEGADRQDGLERQQESHHPGDNRDPESAEPIRMELPRAETPRPQRPQTSSESIDVANGKLTMKGPAGDVHINLSHAQSDEFVQKALHYQQAIIREKKASVLATYAMAALSGLSAVAIGTTLIRSFSSKSKTSIV